MIPLAFLVAVAAATLGVLIVGAIAVLRELNRLGSTLARFQEETKPHLEEIERDARLATERMERMRAPDDGERVPGPLQAEQPSPPRPER